MGLCTWGTIALYLLKYVYTGRLKITLNIKGKPGKVKW